MNIGVIARVPLDEGGLSGKLMMNSQFPDNDWRARYFGAENLPPTVARAEALKELLPEAMSLPEMALRYILTNPIVSTTIVGMRNLHHLQEDVKVSDGKGLSQGLILELKAHRWDRKVTPWSD